MGYLDQLRELCSKMQETSQTKEEIDTSVQLKNIVDGLEAEEAQTLKNYNDKNHLRAVIEADPLTPTRKVSHLKQTGKARKFAK